MSLIVEAVYEDGVLKPHEPLPIKEHERVRLTIESVEAAKLSDERLSVLAQNYPPPAAWSDEESAPCDRVEKSFGMIGYKGDAHTAERVALEDEFGILESP